MAMYHVKSWLCEDRPHAYDLWEFHVPCKVLVYLGREDQRFKLWGTQGKRKYARLAVTLKEGLYTQVMLMDIYMTLLASTLAKLEARASKVA